MGDRWSAMQDGFRRVYYITLNILFPPTREIMKRSLYLLPDKMMFLYNSVRKLQIEVQ